jgi:uncharacterized LabA/DUF88 family protein
MDRVIAYIGGFNLYFGLRAKQWYKYYWLNIQEMAKCLLRSNQILVETKYFTTRVSRPPDKVKRQTTYLEALGTLTDFHIYYGHYLDQTMTCRKCGHSYQTYHEKMTDVNIAVQMLTDAFQDRFDVALLVSADGDLAGIIETVQTLATSKRVVSVFAPARRSAKLEQVASAHIRIYRSTLARCQFPDRITKPGGFVLERPRSWR